MQPTTVARTVCLLLALALAAPAGAGTDTPPRDEETATGVEIFDFDEGVAGATGEIMEAEARANHAAESGLLRVGDLHGRPVLGATGEIVGEIGRVVRRDGTVWAVLESGGFIGIGDDELPVEVRRLQIGPEGELHAPWLTEEAVEQAPDVDLEDVEDVEPDVPLVTPSE